MKKLIQICSLLSLLVLFTVISAKAQTQRFEANIPFDFSVAGKSYTAGKYLLKIGRVPTGKILFIESANNKRLQTALISENGGTSKANSQVRFVRQNDQWVLSNLMTESTGFALPMSKGKNQVGKNESLDSKTGADALIIDLK